MLRRILYLTLGVLLVPIASFAGIYGILTGKVSDNNGKPVIGATVAVQGTDRGGFTRPDGSYKIIKIVSGTYTVKVSGVGFQDFLGQVTISADKTSKLNATLKPKVEVFDEVVVIAKKPLVDSREAGKIRGISSQLLTNTPRENVQSVVAQQAGVLSTGNGFNIRGTRSTNTQFRINGLDVGDQFQGGFGAGPDSDFDYFPTVSNFATEEVQVLTGGMTAEYGNALGGVINTVTKTGKNDKYEGFLRWRTDAAFANGDADNGLPLEGSNENTVEFGVGGPIPLVDNFTFYLSSKYHHEQYRENGIGLIDPLGNNIGQRPNQGLWQRNVSAQFGLKLTDNIRLVLGGTYGATSFETSDWDWLYANDFGVLPNGEIIPVEERRVKQPVNNQVINQAFVRLNHDISQTSFYEVTLSWNKNETERAKRQDFDDISLLGVFDVHEPANNTQPIEGAAGSVSVAPAGAERVVDIYSMIITSSVTVDGYLPGSRPARNPETGYFEGDLNPTGTGNPYGLSGLGFFNTHGNERGFEFRASNYFQVDGNFTSSITSGKFEHYFKTGFELKFHTLERHNNSNPWDGNPFFDVYTDQWGGNFYAPDEATFNETSQPFEPIDGALFVQDRIEFEGIVITPGLRLDFYDPQARFRVNTTADLPFASIAELNTDAFDDATTKFRVSPRLYVAYPVTDNSVFNVSYGIFSQRPQYNRLYDAFNTSLLRGNNIIGNPNLTPQTVKAYEAGYALQIDDDFAFDISAYYRDMFDLEGITFVGAQPSNYYIYSVAEYGNSRGIEFTFRKRPTNHLGFNISYTLSSAKGTASSPTSNFTLTEGTDEFTGLGRTFPLTEYFLDFDRRHRVNATLTFLWGDAEGPRIGGLSVLEHTNLTLSGFLQTGRPYTKEDRGGNPIGEFNGERQPTFWVADLRLERDVPLKDLFGESMGNTRVTLFVDVKNILNRNVERGVFARTGNALDNGTTLSRSEGDFSAVTYHAVADPERPETIANDQYDSFGQRLYNELVDTNKDGVNTIDERFAAYERYVQDVFDQRLNYQEPRTVFFGFMLRF